MHCRPYTSEPGYSPDFHRVRDFLARISSRNPIQYGFEWGRWEWGFSLPYLDTSSLDRIGVWEHAGEVVALVTYEQRPGEAYFALDPRFPELKEAMFLYARKHLAAADGALRALITNTDREMQRIAGRYGFKPTQDREENAVLDIDLASTKYELPAGFSLVSLADRYDLVRYNRVLWRGFNHEGEPPETAEAIEERRVSLSGPHVNLALNVAAVAHDGEFVSYCGMWYDPQTEYALVEPVATDPRYRRLGLGRAAVLEAVKRCGLAGARQAYVGSGQQFYYRLGFHPLPAGTFWVPG